ncbi:hypothetical protein D7X33_06720 [Butyricicoccus sp. 1XD8-22]|nr:hypothetical protein D7X33_06720 [Butyricicoccus sp. 1XD8-22]
MVASACGAGAFCTVTGAPCSGCCTVSCCAVWSCTSRPRRMVRSGRFCVDGAVGPSGMRSAANACTGRSVTAIASAKNRLNNLFLMNFYPFPVSQVTPAAFQAAGWVLSLLPRL